MISNFFFKPASHRPFVFLRRSVAAVLLAQAASVYPYFMSLQGSSGFLQGSLGRTLNAISELPSISGDRALVITAIVYVASLAALLLGKPLRLAATAAWISHTMLLSAGSATKYGADEFAQLALFYVFLNPGSERYDAGFNRFSLRLLQLHLCVAYLATAVAKGQGTQWWNGEAIWRSLTLPLYARLEFGWMAQFPWLAKLSGWGTLLVEGGYAIFIWPRLTRYAWAAMIVGLHLGIAIFLGLWVFGFLMIALTTSAFVVSADPAFAGLRERLFGFRDKGSYELASA